MARDHSDKKRRDPDSGTVTRRDFLTTAGVGAAGIAAAGGSMAAAGASVQNVLPGGELTPLNLQINGRRYRLLVEPRWSLLHVLRNELGLTGAKEGCNRGECGSCTVLIGDETRYACLTLAVEAQEREITTLEGLLQGEELGEVQQAFAEKDAFQCGYCTPGQIMAVEGLLIEHPQPTPEQIQLGVSGNLCRCGAYPNIFKAALRAAELKAGKGGAS